MYSDTTRVAARARTSLLPPSSFFLFIIIIFFFFFFFRALGESFYVAIRHDDVRNT